MAYAPRDLRHGVRADAWAPPPGCPEPMRFVRQGNWGCAVFASQNGDPVTKNARLYLYNPLAASAWELVTNNGVGNWPIAIGYQGEIVWQEVNVGVRRRPITGGPIEEHVAMYSSSGILDLTQDGRVVMDFGQPVQIIRGDGTVIVLTLAMVRETDRGTAYCGQANTGAPGILVYQAWDDTLWRVATGNIQTPPRMDDDGATVALSWDVPEGFLDASAWTPEDVTITPPPIAPFTVQTILSSYDSGQAVGDNGAVVTNEGILLRYETRDQGELAVPWVDLEQHGIVTVHPSVAYADISAVDAALAVLHADDALAFNVYPTAGQPLTYLRTAALDVIRRAWGRGVFTILVGCAWNRLGTLSDQVVLDGLALVRALANEPGVLGIAWFGLNRGTAYGYFKPLYQQTVDRFLSPGWPAAWPPPVPIPPEPQPPHPEPEPDMAYKTFVIDPGKELKQSQSYITFMNDVGLRVGGVLGLATKPPASDTGLTPAGQVCNENYDLWDEAQIESKNGAGTIPSPNVMSSIVIDQRQKKLSREAVKASLIHETPLVGLR